jgi:hypothetical protein
LSVPRPRKQFRSTMHIPHPEFPFPQASRSGGRYLLPNHGTCCAISGSLLADTVLGPGNARHVSGAETFRSVTPSRHLIALPHARDRDTVSTLPRAIAQNYRGAPPACDRGSSLPSCASYSGTTAFNSTRQNDGLAMRRFCDRCLCTRTRC